MTTPSLADLTARFLTAKAAAPDFAEPAEVLPHEIVTSFKADASATWADAKAVFALLGVAVPPLTMPADWSGFVSHLRDTKIMPLSLGAVPQRMRDLSVTKHAPTEITAMGTSLGQSLNSWIDARVKAGTAADLLMAAGVCRTAGEWDRTENYLSLAQPKCTGALAAVLANERASLLWSKGESEGAAAAWQAMPESPVATFNRGICEWQAGRLSSAAGFFDRSAGSIPDRSGWSHLAAFYASICDDE